VTAALLWRLGVKPRGAGDRQLIEALESALRGGAVSIDAFFHDSFGGVIPATYGDGFAAVREMLADHAPRSDRSHPHWSGPSQSMLIDEVETLWSAIDQRDDWAPLHDKIAAVRSMGQALRDAGWQSATS
jgi:serine/tyrosine/threonine adenylyltransferase